MGLLHAAPAVPLFGAALAGVVVAIQLRPTPSHLALAAASHALLQWLVRQGIIRLRLRFAHIWLMLALAALTTYHMAVKTQWLHLLPEGDGVWVGQLYTHTAVDGTPKRILRLTDWQGRGQPRLQVRESDFHEPIDEAVWNRLPDGALVWVEGTLRHPRPAGNPGEFDYAFYLFRQGVAATLYVQEIGLVDARMPMHARVGVWISQGLQRLRAAMVRSVQRSVSPQAGSVLIAMTTGGRELITDETDQTFRRTGTSHLLSVSGLHVGMIGTLALFVARLVRLGSRGQTMATMVAVWGFVLLTGARPSSMRAGLMATLGLLTYSMRRRVEPLQLWAFSGLALLVIKPLLAYDVGFQLSYAATGSILLWIRALQPRLVCRSMMERALMACSISLAAQIGTAPLVAFYFHELSLAGVVVNWIAVPLAAPTLYLTVAGVLLGFGIPSLGDWVIGLAGHIVDHGLALFSAVASWPWSAVEVPAPSPVIGMACGLVVLGLPLAIHLGERPTRAAGKGALLVALVLLSVAAWTPVVLKWGGVVRITFVDVGQGDAILIRTPRGRAILIDGGGSPRRGTEEYFDVGARRLVPYLQHIGVRKLDLIVNTHPDEDHLQGLLAVLQLRHVDNVIDSGQSTSTQTYATYRKLLEELPVSYRAARRGDIIEVEPGIVLHVLGPKAGEAPTSLNNGSVVLRLDTPHGAVLLPGDLERTGQQELLWEAENVTLSAAVIKVPHHGSARDVDWRFIDAVGPDVAVFQVGRNPFGHPSQQALTAYSERGARIYRNDLHGAVTVSLTPWGIRVRTHR